VFRILVVCTGNICRSPVAESVIKAALSDIPEIRVESAGTAAMVGQPVPAEAAEFVRTLGADPTGHAGRQITPEIIAQADLILVAAREHRSAIVTMLPRASRKTFTLREFARLAEGGDGWTTILPSDSPIGGALPGLIAELAARRGSLLPVDPADDDVIDPYRRDQGVYAQAAQELAPALSVIVDSVRRAAGR
jgi:protein-tyrosine phosphatase